MKVVLRKSAQFAVPVLMALLLLFTSSLECWAQETNSHPPSGCCKHPCKQSPGTLAHSTCQAQPSAPERLTQPEPSQSFVRVVFVAEMESVNQIASAATARDLDVALPLAISPPELFLQHSSFLI